MSLLFQHGNGKNAYDPYMGHTNGKELIIIRNGAKTITGLDINVCPIPVKTDVGQVVLVLRLSDWTSEKIRDSQTCRYDGQIYFHWYKRLGLLYKRALFDL